MKFSDEFETRFAEMLTHYPTKRSVLVPTLLYAQDEVGLSERRGDPRKLRRGWN